MIQGTRTTYAKTFTASSGGSGTETVFTVDEGPGVDVDEIRIAFESGAPASVTLGVFYGDRRVAPENGDLAVGGFEYVLPTDLSMSPGDTLKARWSSGAAADYAVTVLVTGDSL